MISTVAVEILTVKYPDSVDTAEGLVSKKRTLEIDEDVPFQKKEWFFQRIGMALLFLFVVAALLGFTGLGGPASRGEAGERDGPLHVEYDRVVRRGGLSKLKMHVRQPPGDVRFWVSASFLEHVGIEAFEPFPAHESVETDRHVYLIHTGSPAVTVTLEVEHETFGMVDVEVGLVDGPSVRFRQLVLF